MSAQPYDIKAYVFQASMYCPTCTLRAVESDPKFDGWADCSVPPMSVEDNLSEIAAHFQIDRMNEYTFDSDEFPKVVFRDMLTQDDCCESCGEDLDQ